MDRTSRVDVSTVSMANDQAKYGLPTATPESTGISAERLARIAPVMHRYIEQGQIPSLLTVVARHGHTIHYSVQGHADVESDQQLRFDTIFRLYSMTKPITAVATMVAYEEGHFFLDDPIADYLPEFRAMTLWTPEGLVDARKPITIRNLLTHTAGLTYSMVPDVPAISKLYEDANINEVLARLSGRTLADHVHMLSELPLIAEPDTAWHYSESFSVLARLIEVVSGQSYDEYLRARLFRPLGMSDTDYHVPPDKQHRLATLYARQSDGSFTPTLSYGGDYGRPPDLVAGGAGLAGTAGDYLKFAQMLLNGGALNGERIVSPSSVRVLLANQLGTKFGSTPLPSVGTFSFRGTGFGFGGGVVTDAIASGTTGSKGEYFWGGWASTAFWIDPVQNLIGMAFSQLIPSPGEVLSLRARMHQMTYQAIEQG